MVVAIENRLVFLKPHRREKKGVVYEYWTLEESVRTVEGPRHRTVATLGKLPGLEEEARVGWEHIGEILDGRATSSTCCGGSRRLRPGRGWTRRACV